MASPGVEDCKVTQIMVSITALNDCATWWSFLVCGSIEYDEAYKTTLLQRFVITSVEGRHYIDASSNENCALSASVRIWRGGNA